MKHFRDRNFLDKRYLSARRFRHWAALFLLTDTAFLFAAWILRPEAFVRMALFLLLFTALALAAGIFAELRRQRREEAALRRFLETPEERTRAEFLAHVPKSAAARELCGQLLSLQERVGEANAGLAEYRDYIEAWVHEVKTPLTLFTMVLDNHKDEMPPGVHARLQYAQHRLNENAERILYYARLHTDHPDMRFSRFRLDECAREALEEYRPLLEEKHILTALDLQEAEVDSDRKIVSFMLAQLFSNAVKYADGKEGKIAVSIRREEDRVYLSVCNNGDGVPPEDEPFLFDRGFTSSRPNRQKATGMGLYLVRKYGQKLCVGVRLSERIPYESGFGIELVFSR